MIESQSGRALADAAQWAAAMLTGTVATAIAVIAIAAIGFAFLQGRIDARRAARTILGCFIIFGAPTVAAALAGGRNATSPTPPTARQPAVQTIPIVPPPAPYDPYAGASVPVH